MLQMLLGAGLSGLGSLLSGMGAKDSAEEQQARQEAYDAAARERVKKVTHEYQQNVPKWLISDANKAGFNPVTWLQAGALGWYGTQLSGLVSSYGNATQAINIPSSMSAIGGAVSSFAGAFMQGTQFEQKLGLGYAELDANRDIALMRYGGGRGPAAPGASMMNVTSPGRGAGRVNVSAGPKVEGKLPVLATWREGYEPFINRKGPDKGASPTQLFSWLRPDAYMPSASAMTDQYEEPVGWAYAPAKITADVIYSATGGRMSAGVGMERLFGSRKMNEWGKETFKGFLSGGYSGAPNFGLGM